MKRRVSSTCTNKNFGITTNPLYLFTLWIWYSNFGFSGSYRGMQWPKSYMYNVIWSLNCPSIDSKLSYCNYFKVVGEIINFVTPGKNLACILNINYCINNGWWKLKLQFSRWTKMMNIDKNWLYDTLTFLIIKWN